MTEFNVIKVFKNVEIGENKSNVEAKSLCIKCVDLIFDDLVYSRLIHEESALFARARKHSLKTCYQALFPMFELLNDCHKINFDFFLNNSYLIVYSYFLDEVIDDNELNPSTKARIIQISSYLLLKYHQWLIKEHGFNHLTLFYDYFKEQTNYLIEEKKWDVPQRFISLYSEPKDIYFKAILLLYPLELCKSYIEQDRFAVLENTYKNYFSFILLADDINDVDSDISNKILTFPIIQFYKSFGRIPESLMDIKNGNLSFNKVLYSFANNIDRLQDELCCNSSIISSSILIIKKGISKKVTI